MSKTGKVIHWITIFLVVPCIIYYSTQFYIYQSLTFKNNNLIMWTVVMCLILFNLVQTFVLNKKVDRLYSQNQDLKHLILNGCSANEKMHYGTREIIMDLKEKT